MKTFTSKKFKVDVEYERSKSDTWGGYDYEVLRVTRNNVDVTDLVDLVSIEDELKEFE